MEIEVLTGMRNLTRREVSGLMLAAVVPLWGQDHSVQIGGSWSFDKSQSTSDRYTLPDSFILVITQSDASISMKETVQWKNGSPRTMTATYTTDGKESVNKFDDGTVEHANLTISDSEVIITWSADAGDETQNGTSVIAPGTDGTLSYVTTAKDASGPYRMTFTFKRS